MTLLQWFKPSQDGAETVIRTVRLGGMRLKIADHAASRAVPTVAAELARDSYRIGCIEFVPGDTVIDIGAHVGLFSIFLAGRFPFLRILAFEPAPQNYARFRRNVERNGIRNVEIHNKAVTGDGRPLPMLVHSSNTGGATG